MFIIFFRCQSFQVPDCREQKEGKIAVFLKPCDSFSFVQLQKEHRINRENIYAVGVQCDGKCDGESLRAAGCEGLLAVEGEEVLNVHTLYGEKSVAKKDALWEMQNLQE